MKKMCVASESKLDLPEDVVEDRDSIAAMVAKLVCKSGAFLSEEASLYLSQQIIDKLLRHGIISFPTGKHCT